MTADQLRRVDVARRAINTPQPTWIGYQWVDADIEALDAKITELENTLRWLEEHLVGCGSHHGCDDSDGLYCRCMLIVCQGRHRCACGHEWGPGG